MPIPRNLDGTWNVCLFCEQRFVAGVLWSVARRSMNLGCLLMWRSYVRLEENNALHAIFTFVRRPANNVINAVFMLREAN